MKRGLDIPPKKICRLHEIPRLRALRQTCHIHRFVMLRVEISGVSRTALLLLSHNHLGISHR